MKYSQVPSPLIRPIVQKATSCLSVESLSPHRTLPFCFPHISYSGNFRSCLDSSAETRLHYWCPLLNKQREKERRREREELREWLSNHAISPFIVRCHASPRGTIRKPNYFPPLQPLLPLLPLACCYFFLLLACFIHLRLTLPSLRKTPNASRSPSPAGTIAHRQREVPAKRTLSNRPAAESIINVSLRMTNLT